VQALADLCRACPLLLLCNNRTRALLAMIAYCRLICVTLRVICPNLQVGKDRLIYAGLASEAAVSGYHADNIAPALMGGFILIR